MYFIIYSFKLIDIVYFNFTVIYLIKCGCVGFFEKKSRSEYYRKMGNPVYTSAMCRLTPVKWVNMLRLPRNYCITPN